MIVVHQSIKDQVILPPNLACSCGVGFDWMVLEFGQLSYK